ncbi:MAG: M61 family metallopeptidase [Bacteroidetes bacterium]|nr:M61 family metallopeptidase [Bacteroidota bacterium]
MSETLAQSTAHSTYTLRWDAVDQHTYRVTLHTAPTPAAKSSKTKSAAPGGNTAFLMPQWRPGRYIDQDFAAGIIAIRAWDDDRKPLSVTKTSRSRWVVQNPAKGNITLEYEVYANTQDAGSSYIDSRMAYFNGATLFLYPEGRLGARCTLSLPDLPADWKAATGLPQGPSRTVYIARDYHELVDCPTIFSPTLKSFSFEEGGKRYWLHFQVNRDMDEAFVAPFREQVRKIIQVQMAVFNGDAPFKEYHFIYWLVPFQIHHAVEHANSAMFCKPEAVADTPQSLSELNGITSHEFWHVWNVKAIRPAALAQYDYNVTPYTRLHWFTEGVTDYYTNLMLARAGLLSKERLLAMQADAWARLDNSMGPRYVSPAESSFDSWLATSRYQPDFLRTSYYSLGSRVGALLDWHIRHHSNHKHSLDDVFRYLYKTYGNKPVGIPEDGIEQACKAVTGRDYTAFFAAYVYGTAPVNYEAVLAPMGLSLVAKRKTDAFKGADKVGILNVQTIQDGYQYVLEVARESPAAAAGIGQGSILLMIDGKSPVGYDWSVLQPGQSVEVMLDARDKPRLVKLTFEESRLPIGYTFEINPAKAAWLDAWIAPQDK